MKWSAGGSNQRAIVTESDRSVLNDGLWQAPYLSREQQDRIIRWSRRFIRNVHWEGCNGLVVDDTMKRWVAYSAGLMVLQYDDWYFNNTSTILIYPEAYRVRNPTIPNHLQIVSESWRAGETTYRGPVVVNWSGVERGNRSPNRGEHIIFHEFAHKLDLINGPEPDGLPPLPRTIDESQWKTAFAAEYEVARETVAQGYDILINDYALSHVSEFFAVASELYFQLPHELAHYHPAVYDLLKTFYVTDMVRVIPNRNGS